MKNQNDLIVTIVALVVGLGVGLGFFFSKRTVQKPGSPEPVPITAAKPQEGAVVMGTSLPGGDKGGNRGAGAPSGGSGAPSGGGGGNAPMRKPQGGVGAM